MSRNVSESQGVPNEVGFMTRQCHRVSGSVSECLREGVNYGVDQQAYLQYFDWAMWSTMSWDCLDLPEAVPPLGPARVT